MKSHSAMRFLFVLPLPAFVLHPLTAVVVAAVHVYLAAGHLSQLIGGDVQWTHFWKGFGALGGAYVFAALASRGLARQVGRHIHAGLLRRGEEKWLASHQHEKGLEDNLSPESK
jgi:hypothetical protein